jgi:hypothetical protein
VDRIGNRRPEARPGPALYPREISLGGKARNKGLQSRESVSSVAMNEMQFPERLHADSRRQRQSEYPF